MAGLTYRLILFFVTSQGTWHPIGLPARRSQEDFQVPKVSGFSSNWDLFKRKQNTHTKTQLAAFAFCVFLLCF